MKKIFTLCVVLCLSYLSMGATNLKHEFRATWLTTAWGNDWPKKTIVTNDATRKQQQDSLIAIFDRLQAGNMNAVCLQVRGRSDAFYQSSYEPWAAELAGARGTDPGYDPLAFAIKEAHKRGLELHAWVNPFRVTSAGTLASTDLVKKNAGQWIIQYNNGSFTGEIIDPGYPEAREYVLNVLMEIISNYDIDGIVMDDYFYPYGGTTTEDAASKALHKPANVVDVNQDGYTDDDWRRSNVDVFLKELYDRIQAKKPWVRFGMGTFGIWTTQTKVAQAYNIALPSGISGLDDYDEQACNPVEWVQNGYVDYINPQLYWPTTSTGQNYNKLCQWWAKDVCEHFSNQLTNGKKVHFFSSQSISSNSAVSEIQAEIDANRSNLSSGYTGSVFFDTDAYLTMDKDLMTSRFATNALTPPMDWKSKTALSAPTNLTISGTTLTWQHATAERFTVYVYPKGTAWSTAKNDPAYLQGVIYGNTMDISGIDTTTHHIAVCAYDRFGVEHEGTIYSNESGTVTPPASGTITYELNGGVQSEWDTPQDMYNELNAIWNAFSGTSKTWGNLDDLKADVAQGIPTQAGTMDLTFIADENFKAKFEWLLTYMDAKCTEQGKTLPSSNASFLRYNLQAFFIDGMRTYWPISADYTTCGVSTLEAYQLYWKSSFANPTNPTEEFVLNAPYKEGYTFAGWYTNADFSGEKVTTINAETTGTLYAKWINSDWIITYTSTNGNIVTPYKTDVFGANIVNNEYKDGQGVITFDGPVTSIGEQAFYGCTSLTSITIPNSVTSIGDNAFCRCESLSSIVIPSSVTNVGENAFSLCKSLTYVKWNVKHHPDFGWYDWPFDYKNSPIKNFCFGDEVEYIPAYLCYGMDSLTQISIPYGVIGIGKSAFDQCSYLLSVTIPNTVKTIGNSAFFYCSSLLSITIPQSITSIGNGAFSYCKFTRDNFINKTTIEGYPWGADIYDTYEDEGYFIKDSVLLSVRHMKESIVIPPYIVGIAANALYGCELVSHITIPNSVRSIGYRAFMDCSSLSSITIPKNVSSIGDGSFANCESMTSIIVEEGNQVYDSRDNCNAIIETATNTLITGCKNTTIPNSVTSIGDEAFEGCAYLTSIVIPQSVTSIGDIAFWGATSLSSITLPNSIKSIGYGAFTFCNSLESITIPSSVISIENGAFSHCPSITSIIVEEDNVNYDSRNNCNAIIETATGTLIAGSNTTVIPNTVKNIGKSAFSDRSISSISIPDSITYIGDECFYGCTHLDTIYIGPIIPPTLGNTLFSNNMSPVFVTPCGTLAAYEASDWANQVGSFVEDCSAKITYELNGGVTNEYGWQSKGAVALELQNDYNAAYGTSKEWAKSENGYIYYKLGEEWVREDLVPAGTDCITAGFIAYVTYNNSDNLKNLFAANPDKYGWLNDIIIATRTAAGLSVDDASMAEIIYRYELSAFFLCSPERTSWPGTSSYEVAGTFESFKSIWKQAFANPTNPAEEFVLNAPYKEGYTFAGWYTTPDFSGEKVTTINAETEGTLYAKWVDYIPTIKEVRALADDTETKVAGVINHIDGRKIYIQDATGGILVYTLEEPTCKVGDKIVAEGVRFTYAGAPEVNYAVIESAETATLYDATTFETLTPLISDSIDHKYFATRVTVPGLKIVSYNASSHPTVADNLGNQVRCDNMPLDPVAFPIGKKVTISAVAGWCNVFQFVGGASAIDLSAYPKKDTYDYPVRAERYTLTNDWVYSNIEGNFAANKPGSENYVRGMAVKDGIMYFIDRETESIVRVDGATGDMLEPIKITGDHLFQVEGVDEETGETTWSDGVTLKFNDLKFDSEGNCLISGCITSQNQTFMVYVVDLETGEAELLLSEKLADNPDYAEIACRFDAFGVAGDVTQNGVIMAADATGTFNSYRWLIEDGEVGQGEMISLLIDAESDKSLLINAQGELVGGWGTAPQIFPQDEYGSLFYVDGFNTLPTLIDEGGMLVEDFIKCPHGTALWNNEGDTTKLHQGLNGLQEFQVGDDYFMVMIATHTPSAPPSAFGLYKFADEGRSFDGLEPLWYFPANGMGTLTNSCRTAPVSVEVEGNKAHLYLYTHNNGYARYTLNVGDNTAEPIDPTWQITYTSTDGNIVTPNDVNVFGANIVSNTYENGVGTITFDGPVTSIGDYAFEDCSSLTSITIPNSVTSIGSHAFCDCSSLTSITIPNSVTSIGRYAFHGCDGLTSVTIPYSVTSIGVSAFAECSYLTSIIIPNGVKSIGGRAFAYCRSLTSITIPNSVTSIGNSVLGGCDSLTSIVVEEGNTIYDSRNNCNAIIETATNSLIAGCQNTIIPNSVTSIGSYAFHSCDGLTSITIPNSVTSIGKYAFDNCHSLTSVIIPNSVTSIGESAFYYCRSLTSITIPEGVTSIGEGAFEGCSSLDTIHVEATTPPTLGENVLGYLPVFTSSPLCYLPCGTLSAYEASDWANYMGEFVEDCVEGQQIYYTSTDGNIVTPYATDVFGANIVSNEYKDGQGVITFDGLVTSIGNNAFYECSNLTSITIPNSVTSIGDRAFQWCSGLTSITIPDSVTSIGEYAFRICSGLTSITIPNSVTSIRSTAFSHCESIVSMVVADANAVYDSRNGCNAIIETATNTLVAGCQNTIIPNSVINIGEQAFDCCYGLTSIAIPNSITSIGYSAFSYCSSLSSVTIPNSVTSIGSFAFGFCINLASVFIPNSITNIESTTFYSCTSLTSITIPNSVTIIGGYAFQSCTSLDTIYVEATTPPALEDSTVFRNTPSPVCVIPCGTHSAYEASDWAQYVSEFVEEGCAPIQKCGDGLYWEYADGVLTITGTGDMYDYAADTDVPWYDVRGNIKTVSLPNAMTKIGQNAFYKCTAMTTINMPTSLTAIGEKAFAQDTKLACEIILPASMTTIASRAFFNCQAVTAFHIEATTPPTIPNDAFERTTAPIHVPCGYGHVYGKHAQWGELNLEMCELLQDNVYYYPIDGHTARAVTYYSNPTDTIVIPSAVVIDGMPRTVTEVADFAFMDCANLPAIYFSEGLEYIGERAFVRCYGLQGTIVLPATLETIGERAFSYCNNVDRYTIQAMTPPVLGANAFTGDNKNALFYISCEAMDDYKVATNWSSLKSRLRDACLNIYHYNTALGANGVHTTEDTLVASIYYRRKFTPYRWETLYLPFEVDRVTVLEDGVEYDLTAWDIVYGGHYFLAKPDGMLNKEILFGFTDELESHTPYIIQFSDAYYTDKLITFYGKESWNKLSTSFEVLSSSAWMQIAGNTTLQDQLLEKPVYMLRSGLDFILQKTTTTLHPFECYVMPYATPSGTPARMNVRFRGDVPTAVESVKGNESHLTYTVDGYTLTVYPQGQAFSIYSLNGALIYSCEAGKEAVDCELNSGCYLLHAGTEAHKIML